MEGGALARASTCVAVSEFAIVSALIAKAASPAMDRRAWAVHARLAGLILRVIVRGDIASDAHREDIARCAVQHAVGGRAQQQGQAMPAMTAHYDQVHGLRLGDAMNLALRTSEHQVATILGHLEALGEIRQVRTGLFVDLVLDRGQIHGNVSAVGEIQWLDDVDDVQLGVGCHGQRPGSPRHPVALLGQVDGEKDSTVIAHFHLPVLPAPGIGATIHTRAFRHNNPLRNSCLLVWIIIGIVLAAAVGPVLWLLPSKRDRLLGEFRAAARRAGLVVEMTAVPKVDATANERVSAGGTPRDPKIECVGYRLTLPRLLANAPRWLLLKSEHENRYVPGWTTLSPPRGLPTLQEPYWLKVGEVINALPGGCVAVQADVRHVTWFGREVLGDRTVEAVIGDIRTGLEAVGELHRELDTNRRETPNSEH